MATFDPSGSYMTSWLQPDGATCLAGSVVIDTSTQSVSVNDIAVISPAFDTTKMTVAWTSSAGNSSSVRLQLYQNAGVKGFVGLYAQDPDPLPVTKSPFSSASMAGQPLALWNGIYNMFPILAAQSIGTMIHRACGFLHEPATELSPAALRGLSSRLRDTLRGLARGLSEKQLAVELRLSPHTVHDYVKALHRHFGVQSRGELLTRCFAVR